MFSNSNLKLGSGLIWGSGLNSIATCPGKSSVCEEHCYSAHIESLRPAVKASTHCPNPASGACARHLRRRASRVVHMP
jgi:hypothetical protein